MRIAIDIRRIADFGVGTYTRNIIRALGRSVDENTYFMIGAPERVREIGPLPSNFCSVPFFTDSRSLKGYVGFRNLLGRLRCDLVHIPHLFWFPRSLPCPYVMTVHDVL